MPLNLRVLLQRMRRTSRILPTDEKNSSMSRARHRWDSCITKMVRASRSSGVKTTWGERSRTGACLRGERERRRSRDLKIEISYS